MGNDGNSEMVFPSRNDIHKVFVLQVAETLQMRMETFDYPWTRVRETKTGGTIRDRCTKTVA